MSFGDTFENDLLKLIFQAVAIPNIADNAATAPLTNIYVALHIGDPGEAGNQTTNECTYTGYARVAAVRTSSGWAVASGVLTNVGAVTFGACTGGSNVATWFTCGTASTGTGKIIARGRLIPFPISNGIQPSFAAGVLQGTLN